MRHTLISQAVKLEREKRKTMREEQLWNLLSSPNVRRLLSLATIVAITGMLTQMENKGTIGTALEVALPGIGIPLIAADAGITSWEALVALGLISTTIPFISTIKDLASGQTQSEFGTKTIGMSGWLTGQGFLPTP
jgi:hypothetical protein